LQEPRNPGRNAAPGIESHNPDDIRRQMEKNALRKVRGLVNSLEGEQKREERLSARAFWSFLILGLILLGVFLKVVVGGYTHPPVAELPAQKPTPE
jgi:hypothetical protein